MRKKACLLSDSGLDDGQPFFLRQMSLPRATISRAVGRCARRGCGSEAHAESHQGRGGGACAPGAGPERSWRTSLAVLGERVERLETLSTWPQSEVRGLLGRWGVFRPRLSWCRLPRGRENPRDGLRQHAAARTGIQPLPPSTVSRSEACRLGQNRARSRWHSAPGATGRRGRRA